MKKNYTLLLFFFISLHHYTYGQLPPIMNSIQGPNLVCSQPAGKSYTASASNSPSSYNWSYLGAPGVVFNNPSSAVTIISFPYPYTNATFTLLCSATNLAGTSNTSSFVVTVKETPSVTFSGANIFCQGSSTNLSASPTILSSSSTLSYSWTPSYGLNSTINYSVTVNATVSTNYTVLLSMGSCTNTAFVNVVVVPCLVGINNSELNTTQEMETYPNPNNGNFIIESDKNCVATIITELGQTIRNLELIAEEKTSITGLKPGIYFIISPTTRKKIVVTDE